MVRRVRFGVVGIGWDVICFEIGVEVLVVQFGRWMSRLEIRRGGMFGGATLVIQFRVLRARMSGLDDDAVLCVDTVRSDCWIRVHEVVVVTVKVQCVGHGLHLGHVDVDGRHGDVALGRVGPDQVRFVTESRGGAGKRVPAKLGGAKGAVLQQIVIALRAQGAPPERFVFSKGRRVHSMIGREGHWPGSIVAARVDVLLAIIVLLLHV